MENGRQKAMDYFSSDEGKRAIKSVQVTFGESMESLKKSMPNLNNFNSVIPHIPNSFDSVERIRKSSEESNVANEQIVRLLAEEQDEIKALKSELKEDKEAHKHDWIKNLIVALIVGIICAAVGVVLTIAATKNGLLK